MPDAVPPWAGEEHVCGRCDLDYAQLTVENAAAIVAAVPSDAGRAMSRVDDVRRRPAPDHWSAVEYLCHLRDILTTSTLRLHRARTEDAPVVEPLLNDLRARRFRYREYDVDAVLAEMALLARGVLDEVARFEADTWSRTVTRRPGETRTARWLLRQAAHEGVHHVHDIEDLPRAH